MASGAMLGFAQGAGAHLLEGMHHVHPFVPSLQAAELKRGETTRRGGRGPGGGEGSVKGRGPAVVAGVAVPREQDGYGRRGEREGEVHGAAVVVRLVIIWWCGGTGWWMGMGGGGNGEPGGACGWRGGRAGVPGGVGGSGSGGGGGWGWGSCMAGGGRGRWTWGWPRGGARGSDGSGVSGGRGGTWGSGSGASGWLRRRVCAVGECAVRGGSGSAAVWGPGLSLESLRGVGMGGFAWCRLV